MFFFPLLHSFRGFLCLTLGILLGISCLHAEETQSPFELGLTSLQQGDGGAAARSFQLAIDQGTASAEIYFNLGLAQEKAGELPNAVVSYLRAWALNPQQPEALQALEKLAKANNFSLPVVGRAQLVVQRMGTHALWIVGCLFTWAGVFALGVGIFHVTQRKLLITLGIVCLLGGSGLLSIAYLGDPLLADQGLVVVNAAVPIRSSPVDHASVLDNLRPGTVVEALSLRGKWTYVALPSGKKGWIQSENLLPVLPAASL